MRQRHALRLTAVVLTAGAALAAPLFAEPAEQLPVREVALFRSGVGLFLRQGLVEDNAAIELSIRAAEINDILKSLIVLDHYGGRIDSIEYPSNEPLARQLAGFGLDLSGMPTMSDLLQQLRGVPVSLQLVDRTVEGTVFGVEKRQVPTPGDTSLSETFVTVVSAAGLQTVPLSRINRFTILDPKLQRELEMALAALAESRDPDKKQVTIHASGEGEREIMAAYVVEMPIWKTSYRLVVDNTGAARLQGWAIVENTTDSDWEEIRLLLVSGQPVSFVMDLYEPLFVPRPQVPVDVVAIARAPVYEAGEVARMRLAAQDYDARHTSWTEEMMREGIARAHAQPASAADTARHLGALAAGAAAAATASFEGEQFFFELDEPVTLPRRRSAMVPVLNEKLPAERVSIFNREHLDAHPMRGVRLENTAGMALMPGPVTVFDGNLYAGDARLPRVAEAGEQLISYAIDLDVDVKVETRSRRLSRTIRIVRGVWTEVQQMRQETVYEVSNKDVSPRDVIIEHAKSTDWKLESPKEADDSTQNFYRFTVAVDRQSREELRVVQTRDVWSRTALGTAGLPRLESLVVDGDAGPKVRQALRGLIARQHEIADLEKQIQQINATLTEIERDQNRIRENIARIDRESELYKRYLNRLSEQETQIEELHKSRSQLNETLTQKRSEFADHLANLNIDG